MKNKFIVVVPVYNSKDIIERCLESILTQVYKNFELVVVDDCSTDGTSDIIKKVWDKYKNFKYHRNDVRIHSPIGNFVKGVELCPGDKEDILVTVDGDDWLASRRVLSFVNNVYQDTVVWLTYGSFKSVSGKMENYCKPIIPPIRLYRRKRSWVTSHLRTIKRKLWDKIDKEDLKDKTTGAYYTHYGDACYMYPAIEMAGFAHTRFIKEVLYVYNDLSSGCQVNDILTGVGDFSSIRKEIKHRKQYQILEIL